MDTTYYAEYAYTTAKRISSSDGYLLPALLRELEDCGAQRVLDIGCGNGALTARLQRARREVYACDLSASGVAMAATQLAPGHAKVAGADTDLRQLFPGVSEWDAIVSAEVIEHLYAPRAFVKRAREALRPGGSLIVTTPYHGYAKNVALAVSGKLDAHFTALWDGGHIKFWSRATLTRLLEEQGFRVASFVGVGRMPLLWKSMVVRAVRGD